MEITDLDMVLYHGNCADGTAASWPFWREDIENRLIFHQCLRDQPPPKNIDGKNLIILDFCYSLEETLAMARTARSIVIIDHHESSKSIIGHTPKNVTVIIDITKSGAQLAWEYLYQDAEIPWFIDVIAAHDLWKWDAHPEYEHLSDVLYAKGYYSCPKLEELYLQTLDLGTEEVMKKFSSINIDDRYVQKAIKSAQKDSFLTRYTAPNGEQYTVRIVNCDRKIRSKIGNYLSKDCDFVVVWQYDFMTNQWWCSARANAANDVDLSKIAQQHGGGGHVKAASFVIYGDRGENLHTYFELIEIPKHREEDGKKYKILTDRRKLEN